MTLIFDQPSKNEKDMLLPMFYNKAIQDNIASEKEGRPIFREVPYIQIHIPGDKNTIIDRKVRPEDKARWPNQWQAFESNAQQPVSGTPLEQWTALSVAQVAELKAMHIPTVEVLAELSEAGLQRIGMGARELQARAKAYIEAAKGNGSVEKIAAENARLQDRIQDLADQNGRLEEIVKRLQQDMTQTKPVKKNNQKK